MEQLSATLLIPGTVLAYARNNAYLELNKLLNNNITKYQRNYANVANKHGKTALMIASEHGNTKIVVLLLEYEANINTQDKRGRTALNWAIKEDRVEIVKLLLDAGADTSIRDSKNIPITACKCSSTINDMLSAVNRSPSERESIWKNMHHYQ